MAPRVGNIYFIAATAVVGGGLFGFDISSMVRAPESKSRTYSMLPNAWG